MSATREENVATDLTGEQSLALDREEARRELARAGTEAAPEASRHHQITPGEDDRRLTATPISSLQSALEA